MPAHLRHVLAGEQQRLGVGPEQAPGHVLDAPCGWRLLAPGDDHGVEVLPAVEPADRAEVGDVDVGVGRLGQCGPQQLGHGLVGADAAPAGPGRPPAGPGPAPGPGALAVFSSLFLLQAVSRTWITSALMVGRIAVRRLVGSVAAPISGSWSASSSSTGSLCGMAGALALVDEHPVLQLALPLDAARDHDALADPIMVLGQHAPQLRQPERLDLLQPLRAASAARHRACPARCSAARPAALRPGPSRAAARA